VRFVDFAIQVLQTQAETLKRLAAFFGEDTLFEMLEIAGDQETIQDQHSFEFKTEWFEAPDKNLKSSETNAYSELESSVNDLKLPAVLEFHLWAYPFYRSIIEGPVALKSKIPASSQPITDLLVNEALYQAKLWVKQLPIRPEHSAQAERAALTPWLRFRSDVLKKLGKRPVASVGT
jgi:hypothetical protein